MPDKHCKRKQTYLLCFAVCTVTTIFLCIESWYQLQGKSLCSSKACAIVGQYISLNESLLVAIGACFFLLLASLFYFAKRYWLYLSNIIFILLLLAVAVDSSLIGFQFFSIGKRCMLCLGVASAIILLSIFFCIAERSFIKFIVFTSVWIAVFGSHSIFEPPAKVPSLNSVPIYQRIENHNTTAYPINTLFFSLQCNHCMDVLAFLAKTPQNRGIWRLATTDTDTESLRKLSDFLTKASTINNPYQYLVELKGSAPQPPLPTANPALKNMGKQAVNLLNSLAITSIPVLISQESTESTNISIGKRAIIGFLSKQSTEVSN